MGVRRLSLHFANHAPGVFFRSCSGEIFRRLAGRYRTFDRLCGHFFRNCTVFSDPSSCPFRGRHQVKRFLHTNLIISDLFLCKEEESLRLTGGNGRSSEGA